MDEHHILKSLQQNKSNANKQWLLSIIDIKNNKTVFGPIFWKGDPPSSPPAPFAIRTKLVSTFGQLVLFWRE